MADGGIILQGKTRTIRAADLFCGAGGTSTGAARAVRELGGRLQLVAVNHWPVAIETHTRMHPEATHLCADLEHVRPRQAVPGGVLDLLMASPTCTYHSRARGGRPVHDQQRMDPWHVVRWCSDLRVHRLLVENVPEMVDWGPCDVRTGRPMPSRKGEYFRAWLDALRGIGFRLDWDVLNCANYGDATTRQRFFLIGRSDRKRLRWPEPTHAKGGSTDLLGTRAPWRSAAEIIDWSRRGKSIFNRARPLKPNTIRRILAGAKRYHWPQVYVDALQALLDGTPPNLQITAEQAARYGIELLDGAPGALVMAVASGGAARSTQQPVPTITTGGNGASPHLIEPLLMSYYGSTASAGGIREPLDTVTTRDRFGLIQAIVMRGNVGTGREGDMRSASEPMPTVTCSESLAVAQPLIVTTSNSSSAGTPRSALDPVRTITTAKGGDMAVAEPVVDAYRIDILYRMLHWRELARAMSFDDGDQQYDFAGTATDIVKQIGNAVPGRTALALIRALLEG